MGHVGDGNFHLLVLFDPNDFEERSRAKDLAERVARYILKLGWTSSKFRHRIDLPEGPLRSNATCSLIFIQFTGQNDERTTISISKKIKLTS